MSKTKSRNLSVDFIRAFAILLVILGHSIQYGSGKAFVSDALYYENPLFRWIYTFHLPLFAVISGYVLTYSLHHRTRDLILQKVRTLLLPVFVLIAIEYGIHLCLYHPGNHPAAILRGFAHNVLTSYWFFWAIFFDSLVVILVEKYAKKPFVWYVILIAASLFVPNEYNSNLYVFLLPYMIVGCVLHHLQDSRPVPGRRALTILYLSNAVLYVILFIFFHTNCYIYTTHTYLFGDLNIVFQLLIDLYRWLIGFSGILLVVPPLLYLYQKSSSSAATRLIVTAGQNTAPLYIINNYFVLILKRLPLTPNPLFWVLETAVDLLISVPVILLVHKSRLLSLLLFGQQGKGRHTRAKKS